MTLFASPRRCGGALGAPTLRAVTLFLRAECVILGIVGMEVAARPGVELLRKNCAPAAAPANLRAQRLPPAQKGGSQGALRAKTRASVLNLSPEQG